MNFFEAQAQARRRTAVLVTLYILVVVAIGLSLYVLALFGYLSDLPPEERAKLTSDWRGYIIPDLLFPSVGFTTLVIAIGSLVKLAQLRQGGAAVAMSVGAIPLERLGMRDVRYVQLKNVVEEMAIASGAPQPDVFVLDEEGINAFAAGWVPENAAIAVTRGALNYLTRDELQGVVAHEFAHIVNGDMRINCRLLALIAGLFAFAIIGRVLMQVALSGFYRYRMVTRARRKDESWRVVVFILGLMLWILGWIGVVAGWIVQAAVSRQREYLADASAVQYTRNPEGIAGALKKIGGLSVHGRVRNPRAAEMAHLFFVDIHRVWLNLLSTHPPLVERIRRLDPYFDGRFPEVRPVAVVEMDRAATAQVQDQVRQRQKNEALLGLHAEYQVDADAIYNEVGNPSAKDLEYARGLKASWPAELIDATRDAYTARALVYALLLDTDEEVRRRQLEMLRTEATADLAETTQRLAELLKQVGRESYLPLAQLAVPTLGTLSETEYQRFKKNVANLILADAKLSLFEYCLSQAVLTPLDFRYGREQRQRTRLLPRFAVPDVATVVGTLARLGHRSVEEAARAYYAAMSETFPAGWLAGHEELPPKDRCRISHLDRALKRLRYGTTKTRELALRAALQCVAYDGRITIPEAEAVRAIAAVLRLPLPPIAAHVGPVRGTTAASART